MRTVQRSILDARRWLCLFMVCCIILCGIGGIHQRAQALVGVDDALIAVVIAGLAAVGITFVSTGAYDTLSEYVGSLLGEYADSRGLAPAGLFTGVQSGANSIGQILINNRFVQLIETFGAWLIAKYSITDNTTTDIIKQGSTLNGYTVYPLPFSFYVSSGGPLNERRFFKLSGEEPVYGVMNNYAGNYVTLLLISKAAFEVTEQRFNNGQLSDTITWKRDYIQNGWSVKANTGAYDKQYIVNAQSYDYYVGGSLTSLLGGGYNVDTNNIGIGINSGSISLPTDDPAYTTGDGAVIDVSAPWGMTYPDIVDRWIPGEWTAGETGNPSIMYDAAPAIDDQVITGPDTASVSSEATEYQTPGLKDVFPFCLPFDVYNFLSCLAADPVAPSFTWRFYVPRLCDETFTVDLSPFDTVAQIVRTMELLAFCIGLAYVTREKFIRG